MKAKTLPWIAAALLLAGMIYSCKDAEGENDIEALIDGSIPKPGGGPEEPAGPSSLKEVFKVEADGKDGVAETFTAVSEYIARGGLDESPGKIKLGDWIDLEGGLEVDEYTYAGAGAIDAANKDLGDNKGKLLRLIVVGINSFNTAVENGYQPPDKNNTPHVVFQFQNIPGTQKMGTDNAQQGYRGSIMGTYLPEEDLYFLMGLTNAGVPTEVLWKPSRTMGERTEVGEEESAQQLRYPLWLPTKWELYGEDTANGNGFEETETNQARLEYYKDHSERLIKYDAAGIPTAYWTASQGAADNTLQYFFVSATGEIKVDGTNANYDALLGVAPAFCVIGPEASE